MGEQQYSFLEGGTELSIVHLPTYLGCWGYGIIFVYYSSEVIKCYPHNQNWPFFATTKTVTLSSIQGAQSASAQAYLDLNRTEISTGPDPAVSLVRVEGNCDFFVN